jgi:putative salt-induced outer membrane protein YdiY
MKFINSLMFLALISSMTSADEVLLKDGMKLVGDIQQVHQDKIIIKTKYAGEITVAMENVDKFHTETEQNVAFEKEQKLVGKVTYEDEKAILVRNEDEKMPLKGLVSIWGVDKNHPDYVEPIDPWTYKAYADISSQEGNTDKDLYSLGLSAEYDDGDQKAKFFGTSKEGSTDGQKTDKEYRLGADYERLFGDPKHHSWYVRGGWENDEIEGIDYRVGAAAGYGYYWLKNDETTLRTRMGLGYIVEEYVDGTDKKDSVSLDLGFNYKQAVGDWATWETDVTYLPAVDDFGDYLMRHLSGISVPLTVQDDWSLFLKLGVQHEYNSEPAEDRDELDTTYFLRLALKI